MNLILLKQISVLSALTGAILGVITLIPYVGYVSFLIAFAFLIISSMRVLSCSAAFCMAGTSALIS